MLTFDEVNVGDSAPEMRHELTRTDLVRYAGASGDYNPMHHDEVKAQAAGMPSVFGHGMFSAGLLATALSNWVGIQNVKEFSVRFVKQTWPGETFVTRVVVASKRVENGENLIDLVCEMANAEGEVKVSGTAVAALPSKR
jgi:acyl dehydratase